jgi:hypothetical protein
MKKTGTKGRTVRGVAVAAAAAAAFGLAAPAMAARAPASAAAGRMLGAGQVGARAAVPWGKVGPGWSLVLFSANQGGAGVKLKAGSSTLYLVDPAGGRYRLFAWAAGTAQTRWNLLAWSGDGRRAMFIPQDDVYNSTGRERVYQIQLRTGALSSFALPKNVSAVGYTRPDGLNILAERAANIAPTARGSLLRFSLTGHLVQNLATVRGLGRAVYQQAGASLAAGSQHGLTLVSNAGGVIRQLRVPGVNDGCSAVRWWSARTILASCTTPATPGPRMWLVPASGARPTALTPPRTSGFDQGDFNAWQLSSGLYVNGYGACGQLVIGKQPARGRERMVTVPGADSSLIVNATKTRLEVERINGCSPGVSLVWFNPATRAMKVAIPVGHDQAGVVAVVPYFIAGKF